MKIDYFTPRFRVLAMMLVVGFFWMQPSNLPAAGRTVRINLGTLAPRGSVFHQALQEMEQKWKKISDGKVRLVIYPDGTQGGEADMVRLMRIGTLHAGLFTAVGLADFEPSVTGLQTMPMAFHDLKEVDYVSKKLRPMMEKRLLDKGFVVLFWADAGWLRYFSKEPIKTPSDLKRMKAFVWAGNPKQVEMMKSEGYNPIGLETGEILTGLQTGLIEALAIPPIFALAGQIDLRAPNMLEINWAPLVGAAVIKKETWDSVPAEMREAMLKVAEEAGDKIQANSRKESEEATAAMEKRGLKVYHLSTEGETEWRRAAEVFYSKIRGSLVPADIFDEVLRLIKEYRAQGGGAVK